MKSRLYWIEDWRKCTRECGYRIDSLAKKTRASERQLRRFFLERFGTAPKAWVDKLLADDAIAQLSEGRKMREVSRRLGIGRVSKLIATIKRVYGQTPRELGATRCRK